VNADQVIPSLFGGPCKPGCPSHECPITRNSAPAETTGRRRNLALAWAGRLSAHQYNFCNAHLGFSFLSTSSETPVGRFGIPCPQVRPLAPSGYPEARQSTDTPAGAVFGILMACRFPWPSGQGFHRLLQVEAQVLQQNQVPANRLVSTLKASALGQPGPRQWSRASHSNRCHCRINGVLGEIVGWEAFGSGHGFNRVQAFRGCT